MLASRVVPGRAPTRAIRLRVSALTRLDLPTLERPTSAITGVSAAGTVAPVATLVTNSALRILTDRQLVGDLVVRDGLGGLVLRWQTGPERLGQGDLQNLVHRVDHV